MLGSSQGQEAKLLSGTESGLGPTSAFTAHELRQVTASVLRPHSRGKGVNAFR